MVNLQNIHSLTEFKRNANSYIETIRSTKAPIVLTVNGEAAVVVQDAIAFQASLDQIKAAQERINQLEFDRLKLDIAEGQRDFAEGRFDSFTDESLGSLADRIMAEGRAELGA
jgi:prevent-host-death family protein